jgi:hypothetical protein
MNEKELGEKSVMLELYLGNNQLIREVLQLIPDPIVPPSDEGDESENGDGTD